MMVARGPGIFPDPGKGVVLNIDDIAKLPALFDGEFGRRPWQAEGRAPTRGPLRAVGRERPRSSKSTTYRLHCTTPGATGRRSPKEVPAPSSERWGGLRFWDWQRLWCGCSCRLRLVRCEVLPQLRRIRSRAHPGPAALKHSARLLAWLTVASSGRSPRSHPANIISIEDAAESLTVYTLYKPAAGENTSARRDSLQSVAVAMKDAVTKAFHDTVAEGEADGNG